MSVKNSTNITIVNGKPKFKRWTILNVDASMVENIKLFASINGYTTSKALEVLTRDKLKKL